MRGPSQPAPAAAQAGLRQALISCCTSIHVQNDKPKKQTNENPDFFFPLFFSGFRLLVFRPGEAMPRLYQ